VASTAVSSEKFAMIDSGGVGASVVCSSIIMAIGHCFCVLLH
jgi:hypothetical protein